MSRPSCSATRSCVARPRSVSVIVHVPAGISLLGSWKAKSVAVTVIDRAAGGGAGAGAGGVAGAVTGAGAGGLAAETLLAAAVSEAVGWAAPLGALGGPAAAALPPPRPAGR